MYCTYLYRPNKCVLLQQPKKSYGNGKQPLFIFRYRWLTYSEEANGPKDTIGKAKVEHDDQLLHLPRDQLGQHGAQGRHQAGRQDQAVT